MLKFLFCSILLGGDVVKRGVGYFLEQELIFNLRRVSLMVDKNGLGELVKSVKITDMMGKINQVIFNGKIIHTENLSSGIYFVIIESTTGEKTVHRMVNN